MKNRVLAVLTVVFSTVLTLVFAELLLSWIKPAPTVFSIDVSLDNSSYRLSPNPKLMYVGKPNGPGMNRYGLRGREYPLEKQGKKRIVIMGDSVTDGLSVKPRFTDVLEERLTADYDIINLAVNGYNLTQEVEFLKELGVQFSPDYVFFIVCANDLDQFSGVMGKVNEMRTSQGKSLWGSYLHATGSQANALLLKSNIYRYLVAIKSSGERKKAEKEPTVYMPLLTRADVDEALTSVKAMASQVGYKPVFVFPPQLADQYELGRMNLLKTALLEHNVPMVDLNAVADRMMGENKKALMSDTWHLNQEGHNFMAALLQSFITSGLSEVAG